MSFFLFFGVKKITGDSERTWSGYSRIPKGSTRYSEEVNKEVKQNDDKSEKK